LILHILQYEAATSGTGRPRTKATFPVLLLISPGAPALPLQTARRGTTTEVF